MGADAIDTAMGDAFSAAAGWALAALGDLTDMVVVLDESLDLAWVNEFTLALLGYDEPSQVVGRSIADFLHPDDLARAGEVVGMMVEESLVVSVTPALYRIRRADGGWTPVELNGSVVAATDERPELVVIVGRFSGDRDLQDRILELLTSGSAPDEVVGLIPEFGQWRHPYEVYAIWYTDRHGDRRMIGSKLATELAAAATDADSPWARATIEGRDVIVGPDELPAGMRAIADENTLGSCWAMPVADPGNDEPAVVIAWSRAGGPAREVHRYALETMGRALTLVLQWRRHRAALESAARRDSLTGVANRARVFELLGELRAEAKDGEPAASRKVGLLYIDLDGFKEVNDIHGHSIGDAVLTEAARRIGAVLRPGDVLGRLGGDEFAIVCRDATDDGVLPVVAQRVIETVARPMRVGSIEVTVGASIGLARSDIGALEPDQLIDAADQALYDAKTSGRGRWHPTALGSD